MTFDDIQLSRREIAAPGIPLVSVVIPAFNTARFVPATLNSVLSQTLREFEILVINDGSPDTRELELALTPYGARIRYIKQPNRGPSAARNAGIHAARGKYIAFLDSDDLWFPEHLEHQVSTLEQNSSLGLTYSNGIHIEDETPISISFDRTPQSEPVTFDGLLREDSTVSTSSTVVLRQAVLDVGLFDETLRRCEDFDLWLRMAHRGVRMTFTRNIQIYHRLANGLAKDSILMKRARAEVYRKADLLSGISASQRQTIHRKISEIEGEIETENVKELLLAGHYVDSRRAAQQAVRASSSWKLRAVVIGLRFFPGLLRKIYRFHLRRTVKKKRTLSVRRLTEAGKLDLEHFTRTVRGAEPKSTGISADAV